MKTVPPILFVLLAISCSTPSSPTTIVDEATTQRVFDHHVQTFQANDLEGVMADYTEASILITPDSTFRGLTDIRRNFVAAFKALPTAGTTMTVTKSVISGDIAYFVWTATTPTLTFEYATDTFIVQDGKIVKQTYAGKVTGVEGAGDSGD